MSFTSVCRTFKKAYIESLRARPGLADVRVIRGAITPDEEEGDLIWFPQQETTQDWGQIGRRRIDATYTYEGHIWSQSQGTDDDALDAAGDKGEDYLSELIDELKTNPSEGVSSVLTSSLLTSSTAKELYSADGANRVYLIDFTITVRASIVS